MTAHPAEQPQAGEKNRVLHVLLVEDDESLREVLTASLTLAGHMVMDAGSGSEALEQIAVHQPDVVLTDLVMPEDGIGVIAKLHATFPMVRVLAMSGGLPNSKLYLGLAEKVGAWKILQKPFTSQEVLDALAEVSGDFAR